MLITLLLPFFFVDPALANNGICDRNPAMIEALTRGRPELCGVVTENDLKATHSLDIQMRDSYPPDWNWNWKWNVLSTNDFKGLENLRSLRIWNLQKLSSTYNPYITLYADPFEPLVNLESLSLNGLFVIKKNSLVSLKNLKKLILSNVDFERGSFNGLTTLEELEALLPAKIRTISFGFFASLTRLRALTLARGDFNNLSKIEAKAFSDLSNLKRLWLDTMKGAEIDKNAFEGLNQLDRLEGNISLQKIPLDLFEPLKNLTWLDIGSETQIQPGTFAPLTKLELLFLNHPQPFISRAFAGLQSLGSLLIYQQGFFPDHFFKDAPSLWSVRLDTSEWDITNADLPAGCKFCIKNDCSAPPKGQTRQVK